MGFLRRPRPGRRCCINRKAANKGRSDRRNMNQTTEATGRTLDDAKRAAAEALGVSVDDLEVEVLEESAKGLFAKTNYRVKASARASAAEPAEVEKPEKAEKPEEPEKSEKPERAEKPE